MELGHFLSKIDNTKGGGWYVGFYMLDDPGPPLRNMAIGAFIGSSRASKNQKKVLIE